MAKLFLVLAAIMACCHGFDIHKPFAMSLDDQAPPPSSKFVCPPARNIAPCTCYANMRYGLCNGTRITQTHVTKFFSAVRSANKVSSSDWLYMTGFSLYETKMTTLDIEPFTKMNFTFLGIGGNLKLTTFVGSMTPKSGEPTTQSIFKSYWLAAWNNSVDDLGLSDLTTSVDPKTVKFLSLNHNKLEGRNPELIPGLPEMSELMLLMLHNNQIQKIEGGQFAKNDQLMAIFLNENEISKLGENAFAFDEPKGKYGVSVWLNSNKLGASGDMEGPTPDDDKIDETAFSNMRQQAAIVLFKNEMDTITAKQFQTYLDNNKNNHLFVTYNKFECDSRLSWLKAKKQDYSKRVHGVDCENDKGRTAFNSEKVQ